MANGKDLELALRIRADLSQGQAALKELGQSVESVGQQASATGQQLASVGESAEQQAQRLQAMIAASLQNTAAQDAMAASSQRLTAAVQAGNVSWTANADAQSAAMNGYHNLERAQRAQESAQQRAAESAAQVTAQVERQDDALSRLLRQIDPVIGALDRLDSQEEQLRQFRSKGLLDADSFNDYQTKIDQARKSLGGMDGTIRRTGVSAAQTAQALQQLPAQFSDIFTSLAGGQNPLLVLIQQGGQIKDSFGGVEETFRALGNQVRSLFSSDMSAEGATLLAQGLGAIADQQSAVVAGADETSESLVDVAEGASSAAEAAERARGAIGGLGLSATAALGIFLAVAVAVAATAFAYHQGSAEADAFRKVIVLTGNAAGTSSDQLMAMAASMDAARGTQRQAASALTEVAATGKIAADQIMAVASAAVAMQQATGRAVSETVAEFVKIADDPVQAVARLNEEYNFLSAAVYEQIAALAAQGDEAAAAQLAMDALAQTMETRAAQIEGNLGLLEQGWRGIKSAAAEAWDEMLGVGREQTLEEQLSALDRRGVADLDVGSVASNAAVLGPLGAAKELWDQLSPSIEGATEEGAKQLEQERNRLQLQIQQRDGEAAWQAELAKLNGDAIKAQEDLGRVREQSLTKVEQKERAIAEYRANVEKIRAANPSSDLISNDKVAKDLASIEKRFEARNTRTQRPRVDQELRAQESYLAQLERQAATLGKTASEVRQYELAEKGLTGAMRARAEAAYVMIDAAEKKKAADEQAKKDVQTLAQLNLDLLNATGQNIEAAGSEIEKKYGDLQKRLLAAGNTEGAGLVTQLMGIEQAKAELSELEQALDRVFSEQARQEQTISTQQQAGLISELGARRQILDLNALTAAQIEKLLPAMRELAAVTGDPAAIERVKDLEVRLGALRVVANEVSNALKAGFETGLAGALEGLATGTMNLQEAATSFIQSIASSLAQVASQQLAAMATDSLMGLFGGAQESVGLTVGATAVTGSAGALTAAGGTLITGAAAITSAAAALAAAGAAKATTSAVSGAVSLAAATGGHITGPGTMTSDSINAWLSNNEYVTRAAVVTQPGALPFLHDFNARGMTALDDWTRVRHSTGGLAGVPAPAMPRPSMGGGRLAEPAAAMSTTVANAVNLHVYDDPERIAQAAFGSRSGEDAFVVMLSRNPAKYRGVLKV